MIYNIPREHCDIQMYDFLYFNGPDIHPSELTLLIQAYYCSENNRHINSW